MTRKTFKDNPAFQFISTVTEAEEEPVTAAAEPKKEKKPAAVKAAVPTGFKLNPSLVEVKSRRLQLVLQPSLYQKIKTAAAAGGLSVNEYIHRTLETATREE